MPLNDTQKQLIQDWIHARARNVMCPMCGSSDHRIDPELMVMRPMLYGPDGGSRADDSRAAPMVTITCNYCAHMRFLSAVLIGLAPPSAT
jgi:hypothetical protein